jgi:hypothetical protein
MGRSCGKALARMIVPKPTYHSKSGNAKKRRNRSRKKGAVVEKECVNYKSNLKLLN